MFSKTGTKKLKSKVHASSRQKKQSRKMSEKKARILRINPFEERKRLMLHELRLSQQENFNEAEACERAIETLMPLIEELPVTGIRDQLSGILAKLQNGRVGFVQKSQPVEVSSKDVYKAVVKHYVDKTPALAVPLKDRLPSAEECLKMASLLEGTTRDFITNLHANLQAFDPQLYSALTARVASPDHTVYNSPSVANGDELKFPSLANQSSVLLKPAAKKQASVPFQSAQQAKPAEHVVKEAEHVAKEAEHAAKPADDVVKAAATKALPENGVSISSASGVRRCLTTAEIRVMAKSRNLGLTYGPELIRCMKSLVPAKVVFRVPNDPMNYHYDGEIFDVIVQRFDKSYGIVFFFRFDDRIGSFGEFLHYVVIRQQRILYPSRDKLATPDTNFAVLKVLVAGQWQKIYSVFPKAVLNLADEDAINEFIKKFKPSV